MEHISWRHVMRMSNVSPSRSSADSWRSGSDYQEVGTNTTRTDWSRTCGIPPTELNSATTARGSWRSRCRDALDDFEATCVGAIQANWHVRKTATVWTVGMWSLQLSLRLPDRSLRLSEPALATVRPHRAAKFGGRLIPDRNFFSGYNKFLLTKNNCSNESS